LKSETRVTQVIDTLQQITHDATNANDIILHNMRKKLLDMLVLEYNKISSQPQNPLNSILALATHLDDPTAQNIGKTFEQKISNNQDTLNTLQSKLALVKLKLNSNNSLKDVIFKTSEISYNDVIIAIEQLHKFGLESALDFILFGKIKLLFTKH
jgi:hypothetical protein